VFSLVIPQHARPPVLTARAALGRADGDVYTALLAMAKPSPLNATEAGPAWEGVLKPVMQRKPLPKL
jgi:hypothetical protein